MTANEFITGCMTQYGFGSKVQRLGQFMMNELGGLKSSNKDLYLKVPIDIDPFYDDEKVGEFCTWLEENWKEE